MQYEKDSTCLYQLLNLEGGDQESRNAGQTLNAGNGKETDSP